MRTLIFILIIAGCFTIGYLPQSITSVLALTFSFLSFILGIVAHDDYVSKKALNGELLEVKKKYDERKYIKDKVE